MDIVRPIGAHPGDGIRSRVADGRRIGKPPQLLGVDILILRYRLSVKRQRAVAGKGGDLNTLEGIVQKGIVPRAGKIIGNELNREILNPLPPRRFQRT